MTNYENLMSLKPREMAWFLMAYSDSCRTCIYKTFYEQNGHTFMNEYPCRKLDKHLSCIKATEAWLEMETESNADDTFMFCASRDNVRITDYNKAMEETD